MPRCDIADTRPAADRQPAFTPPPTPRRETMNLSRVSWNLPSGTLFAYYVSIKMSSARLHRPFTAALLGAIATLAVACSPATGPQVKVLGVSQRSAISRPASGRSMVVFLEVLNRDTKSIRLSRLQYSFSADGAARPSKGDIALSRSIDGESTAIVEVPVELASELPDGTFSLQGKLSAVQDSMVHTWNVQAVGSLDDEGRMQLRNGVELAPADAEADRGP
jgi:hypothetical protein